jgi:transposase
VAVEMTGTYRRPVQRAFRRAGSEARLVHPFASHPYRQPASGDVKTDDTDLEAIFRATVNGFGLFEAPLDETYRRLQVRVPAYQQVAALVQPKKASRLQPGSS